MEKFGEMKKVGHPLDARELVKTEGGIKWPVFDIYELLHGTITGEDLFFIINRPK